MIYTNTGRGSGGFMNNIGCLIFGGLFFIGFFYFMNWLYQMLWWAVPVLVVLSLIINPKVILGSLKGLWRLLQRSPIPGLFTAAIGAISLPFLSIFWFLGSLGAKKMENMQGQFGKQFGGNPFGGSGFGGNPFGTNEVPSPDTEFVDYEEIESKPKKTKEQEWPEEPPAKDNKKDNRKDNPYDQMFD